MNRFIFVNVLPTIPCLFDYKLKPGPATERNAIRIIEMCGYPKEVVGGSVSAG